MAPKLKPADLKKTVYKPGGSGSSSSTSGTPKGASDSEYYKPTDEDKHFKVGFNPLSFSLQPVFKDPMTKELRFDPVGSTENIVYLPYHTNCITSIVIPTKDKSVNYFITDPLSGCNIFIDQRENDDFVCYHANARRYSPPEDEVKANPAAISPRAEEAMDLMHNNALQSEFPDARPLKRLQASEYYAKLKKEVESERKRRTGVEFFGGATVIGFRVKQTEKWEFWFQTYGRITCDKVGTAAAPYKVFETRCFGP